MTTFTWKPAILIGACLAACSSGYAADAKPEVQRGPDTAHTAPPAQVPAKEGFIEVEGARLWYWDTGGSGEPVIFLHPFTGSGASWEYQQPVLAAAGYRVIAYSRRGHFKSVRSPDGAGVQAEAPAASADLNRLVESLRLVRFHLVGSAAGSFVAADYALSYPEKLRSVVLASSMIGAQDAHHLEATKRIIPEGFYRLPPDFRELGPSYRASNPEGTTRWLAIEKQAREPRLPLPGTANHVTFGKLAKLRVPMLLLAGDADLYIPPSLLRMVAQQLPGSEMVLIREAGHAAFWEQPRAFNDAVLDFLRRHGQQARR
jgi:pimeloyl-ACP methyl ester carboxylesterase